MARLMYLMNTSLDGYVEDERGTLDWSAANEEVVTAIYELSSSFGALLYGRKMYEAMVYWETGYAAHDHPALWLDFARQWQAAEKIVYSRTLAEPRSARTRIEREFDADAVRRLKAGADRDLSINGPELAGHALRAGLVDEIQLYVWPVVVGGGKRFFPEGVQLDLTLIEAQTFRNGVVGVRYAVRG